MKTDAESRLKNLIEFINKLFGSWIISIIFLSFNLDMIAKKGCHSTQIVSCFINGHISSFQTRPTFTLCANPD